MTISKAHVDWATAVVDASIKTIAPEVEEHAAAGAADAIRHRLIQHIKNRIASQKKCAEIEGEIYTKLGPVKNTVKRSRVYSAYAVNDELTDLVDTGVLAEQTLKWENSREQDTWTSYIRIEDESALAKDG